MAEVTIYAEQDGGGVYNSASSWSTLFDVTEAIDSDYSSATSYKAHLDGTYWEISQMLFRFDTSDLSGATITDVTLELTTAAWGPGGWGGVAAGAVEAYVISDVIANDYDKSDLVSTSEAQSLYSGDDRAATSPYDAGGSPAGYIRDWEYTSTDDFSDLLNLSGYTCMVLIPANWRTETETSQQWSSIFTQHHGTEAYRPRLVVTYTTSPKVTAASTLTGRTSSSTSITVGSAPEAFTASSTLTGKVSAAASLTRGIVINGDSTLTNDGPYSVVTWGASTLSTSVSASTAITNTPPPRTLTSASTLSGRVSSAAECSLGLSLAGSSEISAVVSSAASVSVIAAVVLSGSSELSSVIVSSAELVRINPVTLEAASTLSCTVSGVSRLRYIENGTIGIVTRSPFIQVSQ